MLTVLPPTCIIFLFCYIKQVIAMYDHAVLTEKMPDIELASYSFVTLCIMWIQQDMYIQAMATAK